MEPKMGSLYLVKYNDEFSFVIAKASDIGILEIPGIVRLVWPSPIFHSIMDTNNSSCEELLALFRRFVDVATSDAIISLQAQPEVCEVPSSKLVL
jgi:hypothetical protein